MRHARDLDRDAVQVAGHRVDPDQTPVGIPGLDGVAERAEQLSGLLRRRASPRRGRSVARAAGAAWSSTRCGALRLGACGLQEGLVGRRRAAGTPPWQTSSHRAESATERPVSPTPRARASARGAAPARSVALRLQAEEPAERPRYPDRAGPVGRRGHGAQSRGERRAGAPARPARGVVGVPRVAGDAPRLGLGEAADRQLRQVRLAEHDRARLAQAPDHLAVGGAGSSNAAEPQHVTSPSRSSVSFREIGTQRAASARRRRSRAAPLPAWHQPAPARPGRPGRSSTRGRAARSAPDRARPARWE